MEVIIIKGSSDEIFKSLEHIFSGKTIMIPKPVTAPKPKEVEVQKTVDTQQVVKRGPGRPRKNPLPVQETEAADPLGWLKRKEDVVLQNVKKRGGWKCANPRKDRSQNTHKFYVSLDFAEKAAIALGKHKTDIMVIRPTNALKDAEKYPKFYFIEPNYTNETARDARCQYIQLWNRNHDFKLPHEVSEHLSAKHVFHAGKRYSKKRAMAM